MGEHPIGAQRLLGGVAADGDVDGGRPPAVGHAVADGAPPARTHQEPDARDRVAAEVFRDAAGRRLDPAEERRLADGELTRHGYVDRAPGHLDLALDVRRVRGRRARGQSQCRHHDPCLHAFPPGARPPPFHRRQAGARAGESVDERRHAPPVSGRRRGPGRAGRRRPPPRDRSGRHGSGTRRPLRTRRAPSAPGAARPGRDGGAS